MTRTAAPQRLVRPPGVDPDAILKVLRVPAECAGKRLDVFVQSQLKRTSRTRARAIIEQSAYSAAGHKLAPSARVRALDLVVLWREPFESDEAQPELRVVHEDPHLLAIDKPPLVTVHPTARYHRHTVKKRLEVERPGQFLALIHRLDRETSGLLLLARTPDAERAFKGMLERRSHSSMELVQSDVATVSEDESDDSAGFEKEYLAIVRGVPADGLVDLPLELDPTSSLRVKMRIAAPGAGLIARTAVTVLATRGGYSLVRCGLHTGRQHQIRVHLSALGNPLVGDKLYGPDDRLLARAADGLLSDEDLALLELPRHALHAHRYRLRHAVTGEPIELTSALPADLQAFWDSIDEPAANQLRSCPAGVDLRSR